MSLRILALALCGVLASAAVKAQTEGQNAPQSESDAIIHVTVDGVESEEGTLWVALCTTSLSIEGCPYKVSAPAAIGVTEVTFEPVPPGVYAVAAYHDLNDNGEFDTFFGIPREPYALSGEAGEELVPTFSDAALDMQPGDDAVVVHMRRLGEG
jgi:uncharacterized protein (DUF2141 family)